MLWELKFNSRVWGATPGGGVAYKQQSGENRHCLQRRFVQRLAWERGTVQKVQLAVVELVETTIFSAMVISKGGS